MKDCFKINGKQKIIMPKKSEYAKSIIYEKKMSLFTIDADFESILGPEDNEKQNPEQFYINKYQKHIACSYSYKVACVNNHFSKPFKTYLGKYAVYNFINNMVEESKYCCDVMKKHFNKELAMTKKDNENFKNSAKCWIYDNDYVDIGVNVKDHCHHWKI